MSVDLAVKRLIDLPEPMLVRALIEKIGRTYDAFGFVFDALPIDERQGWQYLFITEVQRKWIGLDPRLQPGDIDVLIVPSKDGVWLLDKIAAIEVKRLPLRTGKLGRNVDRYGVTQATGLLRDGFPFVGVLHIIVSEPGPVDHTRELEVWRVVDEDMQRIEFVEKEMVDMTGSMAADLQVDRLFSHAADVAIGFNAIALQRIQGLEHAFKAFPSYGRHANYNENVSPALLESVRRLADEVQSHAGTRN
jgi:hypothetical protein